MCNFTCQYALKQMEISHIYVHVHTEYRYVRDKIYGCTARFDNSLSRHVIYLPYKSWSSQKSETKSASVRKEGGAIKCSCSVSHFSVRIDF